MTFTPETAPPEVLIEAFVELLSDKFVFSPDYASALHKLSDSLSNDANAIAQQIKTWCQERPEIIEALEDNLSHRGQSGSIPSSDKQYKELLQNSIRQSFPSPSSPQSSSNPSTQQSRSNLSTHD
ncbi:hypothetical protein [Coleofasciculus sp. G2-EDA-02]|uniref:hypothetical protein n=1 Tax=Coleofasciculus sp. G2-EDA-02 TaxID=3069529 RepID=UPI0032F8EEF7